MGRQQKSGSHGFWFLFNLPWGSRFSGCPAFHKSIITYFLLPTCYQICIKYKPTLIRSVSLLAPRHLSDQDEVTVQRPLPITILS